MSKQNEKRNSIGNEAFNAWVNSNHKSVTILGTGVGKGVLNTRVVEYARENLDLDDYDIPILIGCDSTTNRDDNIPAEFKKRGISLEGVKIECYQSLYKLEGKKIGLFIGDEYDVSLTPKYSLFYVNNDIQYMHLSTATLNPQKRLISNGIAPITYEFGTMDSQDAELINKTVVIIHYVSMYTHRTITAKSGKLMSERDMYKFFDNKYVFTNEKIAELYDKKSNETVFTAKVQLEQKINALKRQRKMWAIKRANLLFGLESSAEYARKLSNYLLEKNENNKILIFTKFTELADQIACSYHNGTTDENLVRFNNNEIRALAVSKKVQRGYNFKDLNHVIACGFDSSEDYFEQAINGRATRLRVGETAYLHLICPTVDGKPTRASEWIENILKNFDKTRIVHWDARKD